MTTSSRAFSLAVVGGSGGCGASVLTGAIATRAAKAGHRAVAIDLDPSGGGLDVVLGIEREPGPRWRDLHGLRGEVDGAALLDQLPETSDGAAVMSFDRSWFDAASTLIEPVMAALRATADVMIIDAPHHLPSPIEADATVLVAHGTLTGLAAAQVTADRLVALEQDPWLLTRDVEETLTRQVAEALQLPLIGELRRESSVEADLARGLPPGRSNKSGLARIADQVLRDLMIEERLAS
ncbi:hypothetical protein [Luteipulveratus mongoliensis]|uniref:nucleotide-binding protein n=1 Tax=Luteipulveratus mongoliensis TaxID=571913 RepID=UPI0006963FAB|nr:hypothetical protein [Luteipulveratus mongoliensis]